MSAKIIGIDVDGVLADFNAVYKLLIEKVSGLKLPDISDYYPNTWNYDVAAGASPAHVKEAWKFIKEHDQFWYNIPAYPDAKDFLDVIDFAHMRCGESIYFITNRVGHYVKHQTEAWLRYHGFPNPTVLITADKAGACNVLGITHYIDDKNENCYSVHEEARETQCYMLARPWNTKQDGVPRLATLEDFLIELEDK
jgi:hypothetical protein